MQPTPDFLCCEWSAEIDEPMLGTAVTVDIWFMLEYTRPWNAKATTDNELPNDVLAWFDEKSAKLNGRLQFIRQTRSTTDQITFFVGINHETHPRLYEFHLSQYEDLFELDIDAMVAGNGRYEPHIVTGNRLFICTNGKRDRSCALYGAALYRAMAQKMPHDIWMTTHLGGHRFAATLLSLPDGVCYGRIAPEHISALISSIQRKELLIPYVRGRTCYSQLVQTADALLRQETDNHHLHAWQLNSVEETENGRWHIQFKTRTQETYHLILLAQLPIERYVNSGKLQTKPVAQYYLQEWHVTISS